MISLRRALYLFGLFASCVLSTYFLHIDMNIDGINGVIGVGFGVVALWIVGMLTEPGFD